MAGTATKVIKDKALLLALALLITAPLLLAVWAWPRDPLVVETREQLQNLDDDEHLVVSRNLDDEALTELPRLTKLEELQLWQARVSDEGLAWLGKCTLLHTLVLSADKVTDRGLFQLASLKSLHTLTLAGMPEITDAGLAFLAELPALRTLSIIRCARIGPDLSGVLPTLQLEHLDLEQCRLVGDKSAQAISHIRTLKTLNLNFCEALGDEGIRHLAKLPALEVLHLHSIPLMTDESLKALAGLKTLKVLELPLHTAPITPQGIADLKAALPECQINR